MENNLTKQVQSLIGQKDKFDIGTIEAMKETFANLLEPNGVDMNVLASADNVRVVCARIVQNAKQGGILNKDYYLVSFQKKLAEIKTAKFLISLAMKFSIEPIALVKYDIVFEGDKLENNQFGYVIEKGEADDTSFNNVKYGIAEVIYKSGIHQQIKMSKNEFEKIKDTSPSKSSDYSPGNKGPIRMCENKLLKKAFKAIAIDNKKMLENGYSMVEDEVVLKTSEVNGKDVVVVDQYETDAVMNENVDLKQQLIDMISKDPTLVKKITETYNSINDMSENEIEQFIKVYKK